MKHQDIKEGETYHFVATVNPEREHLINKPFHVVSLQRVWRRSKGGRRKTYRAFNDDGVGARPDELEPLPENPCSCCQVGEMQLHGMTKPNGRQDYRCTICGHEESFP